MTLYCNYIHVLEKKNLSKDNGVTHHFHEILDIIEQMLKKDDINADPDKFFSLIERVSESRSVSFECIYEKNHSIMLNIFYRSLPSRI